MCAALRFAFFMGPIQQPGGGWWWGWGRKFRAASIQGAGRDRTRVIPITKIIFLKISRVNLILFVQRDDARKGDRAAQCGTTGGANLTAPLPKAPRGTLR